MHFHHLATSKTNWYSMPRADTQLNQIIKRRRRRRGDVTEEKCKKKATTIRQRTLIIHEYAVDLDDVIFHSAAIIYPSIDRYQIVHFFSLALSIRICVIAAIHHQNDCGTIDSEVNLSQNNREKQLANPLVSKKKNLLLQKSFCNQCRFAQSNFIRLLQEICPKKFCVLFRILSKHSWRWLIFFSLSRMLKITAQFVSGMINEFFIFCCHNFCFGISCTTHSQAYRRIQFCALETQKARRQFVMYEPKQRITSCG